MTETKENSIVEEAVVNPVVPEAEKAGEETKKDEKEADTNLDELIAFLRNGDGYLATVTVLSNGKLSHHMLTKNFPELDLLKSLNAVKKMAVERLENI
jgi:hypothetical protein